MFAFSGAEGEHFYHFGTIAHKNSLFIAAHIRHNVFAGIVGACAERTKGVTALSDYIIEMLNITKVFPGAIANDDITLQLRKGEIHAVLGENGVGKSTLMGVLSGEYQPDRGEIRKNRQKVTLRGVKDARALGIGMVHQQFKLVETFNVLDNIILGAEPAVGPFGLLKKADARRKVIELSERYGLKVDPDAMVEDIAAGMKRRTEILKMLYRGDEVLIFDEPTAVLTPQETDELMTIMKGLAAEGKSILFMTHKPGEAKAAADRCTVLRKGRCVGTVEAATVNEEELGEMMAGRKAEPATEKAPWQQGASVLSVQNLVVKGKRRGKPPVNNVSFNVRRGEIVCIAGIEGNGQSELVCALTGLMKAARGKIYLNNTDITRMTPRQRCESGLAHIPQDGWKHGLILDDSLENNFVLKRYYKPPYAKNGFLNFDKIRRHADKIIDAYGMRSGQGAAAGMRGMSCGDRQKAIIAREIEEGGDLLIAVQPASGLDTDGMAFVRGQLMKARGAGKAVLLVSQDLDEVLGVPDRILVMHEGEIVGELDPRHTTANELGLYMAGMQRNG